MSAAKNTQSLIWCLGLNDEQITLINSFLGTSYIVEKIGFEDLLDIKNILQSSVFSLFVGCGDLELDGLEKEIIKEIPLAKVLIFNEEKNPDELDLLKALGAEKFARMPLISDELFEIINSLHENINLYASLNMHERSLNLYKELFDKKHEAFNFVNSFIEEVDCSSDIGELLNVARFNLSSLFPLNAMHAIFLNNNNFNLYLETGSNNSEWQVWADLLKEKLSSMISYELVYGDVEFIAGNDSRFEKNNVMILPLQLNAQAFGALALDCEMTFLSKDQSNTVNICLKHFAYAAKLMLLKQNSQLDSTFYLKVK